MAAAGLVLSCFPGLGKTYAFEHFSDEFSISDSDSSKFHYIENGVVHHEWPWRYLDHIEERIPNFDFVFVSTHEEVRRGLIKRGIEYLLVLPPLDAKQTFIDRYKARGSSKQFIELLSSKWNEWVSCEPEQDHPGSRVCFTSKYLDREFLRDLKDTKLQFQK
jgi:hypothetical protein